MSFEGNLDKILQRQAELSEKLSSGIRGDDFVQGSKDYSELEPIVEKITEYKKAKLYDLNPILFKCEGDLAL